MSDQEKIIKADQEKIIKAFTSTKTGLTNNIVKLKQKNPELKTFTNTQIDDVLMKESKMYQRNKTSKKVRQYISYKAHYVGELIHMDLMFLASPRNTKQKVTVIDEVNSKANKYQYLLILVDTFSRYLMIGLVKSKKAEEVGHKVIEIVNHLREVYYHSDTTVKFKLLCDNGTEFSKALIEKELENTELIRSKNKYGAVIAENYIFKLRSKLRYMNALEDEITVEELRNAVDNINNEINQAVSKTNTPNEIVMEDEMPDVKNKIVKYREPIPVRSIVRIVNYYEKYGRIFIKKSMYNNWSDKVFSVLENGLDSLNNIWKYKLCSIDANKVLDMYFYESELLVIPSEYVTNLSDEDYHAQCLFNNEEENLFKIRNANIQDFK
jgi:hypothetical protein